MQCVDCSGAAVEYDHRDYRQPLAVEPVCRSCNLKRGPAIPRPGSFEARIAAGHVPYSLRERVAQLFARMGIPLDALNGMPRKLGLAHWSTLLPLVTNALHGDQSPCSQ